MVHTKSQGHRPSGSAEDFERVFTIYGHGGHLGHVSSNGRHSGPKIFKPEKNLEFFRLKFWVQR